MESPIARKPDRGEPDQEHALPNFNRRRESNGLSNCSDSSLKSEKLRRTVFDTLGRHETLHILHTDLRYLASPIAGNVNPNGTERGTGNDLVRFQFVVIAKLVHAL